MELNTVEAGGNGPTQREILQQWGGEEPDFWNESRVVGDWNLQSLGLVALPSSIGDLTISSSLQLSRNRNKSLPDSFGNLTIVGDLLLDRNGLETLPHHKVRPKLYEMHGLRLLQCITTRPNTATTRARQTLAKSYTRSYRLWGGYILVNAIVITADNR